MDATERSFITVHLAIGEGAAFQKSEEVFDSFSNSLLSLSYRHTCSIEEISSEMGKDSQHLPATLHLSNPHKLQMTSAGLEEASLPIVSTLQQLSLLEQDSSSVATDPRLSTVSNALNQLPQFQCDPQSGEIHQEKHRFGDTLPYSPFCLNSGSVETISGQSTSASAGMEAREACQVGSSPPESSLWNIVNQQSKKNEEEIEFAAKEGNSVIHVAEKSRSKSNRRSFKICDAASSSGAECDFPSIAIAGDSTSSCNDIVFTPGGQRMKFSEATRNGNCTDDASSSSLIEGSLTLLENHLPLSDADNTCCTEIQGAHFMPEESEALSKASSVPVDVVGKTSGSLPGRLEAKAGVLSAKSELGKLSVGCNSSLTTFLPSWASALKLQSPKENGRVNESGKVLLITQDVVYPKNTRFARSLRRTHTTKARREVSRTLHFITASLTNLRRKRSFLRKRARSSIWGEVERPIEIAAGDGKLVKCNIHQVQNVLKSRLQNRKYLQRHERKSRKAPEKLGSEICDHGKASSNGRVKVNAGQLTESLEPAVQNCFQPELQGKLEALATSSLFEAELASGSCERNLEHLLSRQSIHEKDMESTVTHDSSAGITSSEVHGGFLQVEAETSGEVPNERFADSGALSSTGTHDELPCPNDVDRDHAASTSGKTSMSSLGLGNENKGKIVLESSDSDANDVAPASFASPQKCTSYIRTRSVGAALSPPPPIISLPCVFPAKTGNKSKMAGSFCKKIEANSCQESVPTSLSVPVLRKQCSMHAPDGHIQMIRRTGRSKSRSSMKSLKPVYLSGKSKSQELMDTEIGSKALDLLAKDHESKRCFLPKKTRTGARRGRETELELGASIGGRGCNRRKRMTQKSVRQSKNMVLNHQNNEEQKGMGKHQPLIFDIVSVPDKNDNLVVENQVDAKETTSRIEKNELQFLEPKPRTAWVRCDDCYKWRRISVELADEIDATNCKWICKENLDKRFTDCSVPQEKSNAEINAELELSDASGEDDLANQRPKSLLPECKQPAVPPQAQWTLIKRNIFLHRRRKAQTIDEIMVCHCKPPSDGSLGCGDGCLNRMLNIECVNGTCPCGKLCSNQKFQRCEYAKFTWFRCGKKGYGLQLLEDVSLGDFLIEYVGEVLDLATYEARQREYASRGQKHFYFMTLNGSEVIDACNKGNLGRFINHSCDPNCRTEKWMVNGEVCIGLFALRDMKKGDEVTFDYNYVRVFGAAAKRCLCGSSLCRGCIGGDPSNAEEVVQVNSDDEYPVPVMLAEDEKVHVIKNTQKMMSSNNARDSTISSFPIQKAQLSCHCKKDDLANDFREILSHEEFNIANPTTAGKLKFSPSVEKACRRTDLSDPDVVGNHLRTSEQVNRLQHNEVQLEISELQNCARSWQDASPCALEIPDREKTFSIQERTKNAKNIIHDEYKENRISSNKKFLGASYLAKRRKSAVNHVSSDKAGKHLDGAVEKLNELLDENGGIIKSRDAAKNYLKLLYHTFSSEDHPGDVSSESTRDLSIFLDAILLTKSFSVLDDILHKNGFQMLHTMLKRNRENFNKIPVIRKLLKVLEYLADREVLTLEQINADPPYAGIESFKQSVLTLTRHKDVEVHRIARNFRDRWISQAMCCLKDDLKPGSYYRHNGKDYYKRRHDHDAVMYEHALQDTGVPINPHGDTRVSKCGLWSQARETSSMQHEQLPCGMGSGRREDFSPEDAPPGFAPAMASVTYPSAVIGLAQPRFFAHLPVSYGIPWGYVQAFGTPGTEGDYQWAVAPGVPFQPFPPLPPYPRGQSGNAVSQRSAILNKPADFRGDGRVRKTGSGYFGWKHNRLNHNARKYMRPWPIQRNDRGLHCISNGRYRHRRYHNHRYSLNQATSSLCISAVNEMAGNMPPSCESRNENQCSNSWTEVLQN